MKNEIGFVEWKVGNKYPVQDIMSSNEATLEGFILNQCAVSWKDQSSYQNKGDNTIWFVLSFNSQLNNSFRYVIAKPSLGGYISNTGGTAYSSVCLYGQEYSDSIDGLLKKLRQNWVFTKELCYDAKYKEGFKQN